MAILIIRHAETALNTARVVQVPDTPLSERGMEQANRLGKRLASYSIGRILSSDYARAKMTAEAIHESTRVELAFNELLRERNFGDVRGTPYSELKSDIFDEGFEPPSGESVPVFDERVARAWREVVRFAAEVEGDLAVVTHGLVCRSLARYHLADCPVIADTDLGFANTSLTIVEPQSPWRISRFACIEHLQDQSLGGAPV